MSVGIEHPVYSDSCLPEQSRCGSQNPRWDFVWRGRLGLKVDFEPVLPRSAGAGALPRSVVAVSTAGSGAIEAFCARLRRRLFVVACRIAKTQAPNDHDVSGTAPPSCMTSAQRSRIALNVSSMAALIFKYTRRPWRTILPAV